MIDVKELRVGNIILDFGDYPNNLKKIPTVIKIAHQLNRVYFFDPIPLTEDILLKCGFTDGVLTYGQLSFAYDDEKRLHKAWAQGPFSVVAYDIEYLHELQNIYYWLSGKKELEVKL